jgi:hypothetical protein
VSSETPRANIAACATAWHVEREEDQHLQDERGEASDHDRERDDEAREIHLGEDGAVGLKRIAGGAEDVGEVAPAEHPALVKQERRQPVRRGAEALAEDQRERERLHERHEHEPQRPEHGLLKPRHEIAAHEHPEQVAVVPQPRQIERDDPAPGAQDAFGGGGGVVHGRTGRSGETV